MVDVLMYWQHPNPNIVLAARQLLKTQITKLPRGDLTQLIELCVMKSPSSAKHFLDEFKVGGFEDYMQW